MAISVLRLPNQIRIVGDKGFCSDNVIHCQFDDVVVDLSLNEETMAVSLKADTSAVREVVLVWKDEALGTVEVLGDHWERAYGDLEWKKPEEAGVMPWYFLDDRKEKCLAYGVKVRPSAMCWWEIKDNDVLLHLDVRCGGAGVVLAGRTLEVATVLMKCYETSAFEAGCLFCAEMCDDSVCKEEQIYGSNNWYYAYGKSSREDILKDTAYLASMTEGLTNRPFMVIDDGWQVNHTEQYNGGPWRESNADYGDMGQLATDMKKYNVRPGIWVRPLVDISEDIPKEWRLQRDAIVLDISVPEVLEHIREDICQIADWGYELVKYDFSTADIFGRWGMEMGSELTSGNWQFADTSHTTAELIIKFYETIYTANENLIILGCNCIGHLGAGLMHLNRTGDDTSGIEWERTKKMGINTLAFRMIQQKGFYGADADCVGITGEIPWEKNGQWLDLLAVSGTPLFVSVKPGVLNSEQEEQLRQAYKKASVNKVIAEPLDWKESKTPKTWKTFEGILNFEW